MEETIQELTNLRCGPFGTPTDVCFKEQIGENSVRPDTIRVIYAKFKDGILRKRIDRKSYYTKYFDKGHWREATLKPELTFETLGELRGYTYIPKEEKKVVEYQYASLSEQIKAESKARKERYANYKRIMDEAFKIGREAGANHNPIPMYVYTPKHPFGIGGSEKIVDETKPQYVVDSGVCGFAWLEITPGNCSFARWLIKQKMANKAYGGGVSIWIYDFGQSMERKQKMAQAMAKYINESLGEDKTWIRATSRMD